MSKKSIRLFSKRHEESIFNRTIGLSLPERLRRRIWSLLNRLNYSYEHWPNDSNWAVQTSVLEELPSELCFKYGTETLPGPKDDQGSPTSVELKQFIERGYPSRVFDVAELFYFKLSEDRQPEFQRELNTVFEDEVSPWRMADGQLFKIDSQFLDSHVIARSYELLKAEGFEGALEEFNRARNELAGDNVKGAILNACKSLESVLKAALQTDTGTAKVLINKLVDEGFYDGLPEEISRAFGDQVLMALPFIRNRLAGHGQGNSIVDVPRIYGELAIHLAATFLLFIVQRSSQLRPSTSSRVNNGSVVLTDSDIPF
jgi:hypothetical protein